MLLRLPDTGTEDTIRVGGHPSGPPVVLHARSQGEDRLQAPPLILIDGVPSLLVPQGQRGLLVDALSDTLALAPDVFRAPEFRSPDPFPQFMVKGALGASKGVLKFARVSVLYDY